MDGFVVVGMEVEFDMCCLGFWSVMISSDAKRV